jgi:hypothetical protein
LGVCNGPQQATCNILHMHGRLAVCSHPSRLAAPCEAACQLFA